MLDGINVLCHNSIRIDKGKIIYIDPFKINRNYNDADIIFITHSHYDHFSPEDIQKVMSENTIFVVTNDILENLVELGIKKNNIIIVEPNNEYKVLDINVTTIPAYNINKNYHPRENNWVGYILEIEGIKYYITGDTDMIDESKIVKCDVIFVAIGGTYTMNVVEAAELVNIINPVIAIPVHYGSIVGNNDDAKKFKKLLKNNINCCIMI